jgi:CBS domain-containing protein
MQVREIMTQPAHTIQASATAEQAAELMAEFNIGTLPVCDGDHIIGMITDRDILIRCVAQHEAPAGTIIRNIMTANPAVAKPTDSVEAAVELLGEREIMRLPVVEDSHVVGLLSAEDVVRAVFRTRQ